jgi:hypothetical protein
MIQAPQQGVQAVNDLPAKQKPPGDRRIHVQRIIVARKFSKSVLIVWCKYTLSHIYLSYHMNYSVGIM